ncbi:MAG: hypothetical protein CM1200mP39_23490 [Dehalococcoidia bacterium]|nr:MAG: hypothetical protein CM1200mP39_23490 [Dehalococcoidia bacterium]
MVFSGSSIKNWRWFKLVSVIGSYAGFALWFGEYEDRNLSSGFAIVALTFLFFLLFLAVSGFHLIRRLTPRALDVSPMVWNAPFVRDNFLYLGSGSGTLGIFKTGGLYRHLDWALRICYLPFCRSEPIEINLSWQ